MIRDVQQQLMYDMCDQIRYWIRLTWKGGKGCVHLWAKSRDVLSTVNRLTVQYTTYWKEEYVPEKIDILDARNPNPHVSICTHRQMDCWIDFEHYNSDLHLHLHKLYIPYSSTLCLCSCCERYMMPFFFFQK